MSERTDWAEFSRNTPDAFWDVAIWPDDGEASWLAGSLDVADRKRIFEAARAYSRPTKGETEERIPPSPKPSRGKRSTK